MDYNVAAGNFNPYLNYGNSTSMHQTNYNNQINNGSGLKRPLTLDLDKNGNNGNIAKRGRTPLNNRLELLSSPDLHMLKLASPEIERLIMQQNITILSTPTSNGNTSNVFFPKTLNEEEQDVYVKGFEAFNRLHQNQQQQISYNNSNSSGSEFHQNDWGNDNYSTEDDENSMNSSCTNYSSADKMINSVYDPTSGQYITIKEEPGLQIVPSGTEPIDMESQEKIKLERKRMRNRVAASKCRRRKLERISKLEDRVKQIKAENYELNLVADKLRDSVKKLKAEIAQHTAIGCSFGNSNYILN